MKGISLVALCLFTTALFGQIPNSTFNEGTESLINGWKIVSGNAGAYFSTSLETSRGDTVVSAASANDKFAKINNNGTSLGVIRSEFEWTERSAELNGRFIYIANSALQRITIKVVYLDWIPALLRADTMMEAEFNINPYGNEVIKNFDWFQVKLPIEERYFRLNGNPDSCIITISCDNEIVNDENTVLLIDQLSFGTEVIASQFTPSVSNFSVYPNPTNGLVHIQGLHQNNTVTIASIEGRVVESFVSKGIGTKNLMLNEGIYFIHISDGQESSIKKLVVSK